MAEEGPLGGAEERVGLHVRGAGAGADAAEFVFDEEFADEGFAEAGEGGVSWVSSGKGAEGSGSGYIL